MPGQRDGTILTLNTGSSSVKFALYRMEGAAERLGRGSLERIGLGGGAFRAEPGGGEAPFSRTLELPDHDAALAVLFDWLRGRLGGRPLAAAGHRVVMGGPRLTRPQRVT